MKKIRKISFWISAFIAVAIILSGCGSESSSSSSGGSGTTEPDYSKLTPECFVEDPANPLLESGDIADVSDDHWNDPHVIKIGDQYVMFASSPTDNTINDVGIYRFTSNDGISWTLNPSTPMVTKDSVAWTGGWASKAVETPSVVAFNGTYHMFFKGYDNTDPTHFRIGHATSADSITWDVTTDYLLGPSSTRGGAVTDFDYALVGEPGPTVFNNKIYLYYVAQGFNIGILDGQDDGGSDLGSQVMTIGLITSSDGTTWSASEQVLVPDYDNLFVRHIAGTSAIKGFSTPHAAVLNNKVYLFHDVWDDRRIGGATQQVQIRFAYSNDGKTNWTQASTPIFDVQTSNISWTDQEVRSPAVYLNGSNLMLWFAGHKLTPAPFSLKIGLATCPL